MILRTKCALRSFHSAERLISSRHSSWFDSEFWRVNEWTDLSYSIVVAASITARRASSTVVATFVSTSTILWLLLLDVKLAADWSDVNRSKLTLWSILVSSKLLSILKIVSGEDQGCRIDKWMVNWSKRGSIWDDLLVLRMKGGWEWNEMLAESCGDTHEAKQRSWTF